MSTDLLPVPFAAKPKADRPKSSRKPSPSGKAGTSETVETDPRPTQKKILTESGAFFLTPGPAAPKPRRP